MRNLLPGYIRRKNLTKRLWIKEFSSDFKFETSREIGKRKGKQGHDGDHALLLRNPTVRKEPNSKKIASLVYRPAF